MPSNQEFKLFITSLTPDQINFIGQIAINPGRQVEDPQTIEIRERVQREMAKEKDKEEKAEATRKRKEKEEAAKARMLRVRTEKYIRLLDESKKAHEKAQLAEQKATEYKETWGIELPAPEPEPAPEDEEDSDEESIDVEEIIIDGKNYYKTEGGTLYDPDTGDEIGKLIDGKIVEL